MAKNISMFLSFFLFVLIAIPTSSSTRMMLQEVQELPEFCPEYDPELRCATPWDPEFTCPESQHPCRSNCGDTRCLPEFCPEYDPALRCATPWDPQFTCSEGQHPCRSNCGDSRCLTN
ncbi:hypothetical protein MKX01_006848 [Papaver californicum]|nr:hypothetical protein MKX01_006848 [Papaver californicum]